MKTGKSIVELAQALEATRKASRDFIVPTSKISVKVDDKGKVGIGFENNADQSYYDVNGHSFGQLVSYADVPKQYSDRIRAQNPSLLANCLTNGIAVASKRTRRDGKPESRMIRTMGDRTRAFLSSSYKRIDSWDLLDATLPVLVAEGFEPRSSELTERRMYLRASTPRLQAEVKAGDVVEFGISISNSDVGAGTAQVNPFIRRLVCDNGLEIDYGFKKFHVGRNQAGNDFYELLSDSTKELTEKTFLAQIKDVLNHCVRPEVFQAEVEKLKDASVRKITNFDLDNVVELAQKTVGVSGEANKTSMLEYLANGADGAGLTQWGLVNAFTYAAGKDHNDFDQSVEMERAGHKILTLNPSQWKKVAETV